MGQKFELSIQICINHIDVYKSATKTGWEHLRITEKYMGDRGGCPDHCA